MNVKSSAAASGGKFKRKLSAVKTAHARPGVVNMLKANKVPKTSVKSRALKLFTFPSFDKCDSLLFFPTTMTKCLNSGDYPALSKLMSQHLHKSCVIDACLHQDQLNSLQFLALFVLMGDIHPDSIMCVHSTTVIENEIHASIFGKFTDNKVIHDSVARTVKDRDPIFADMFIGGRSEHLKKKMLSSTELNSEDKLALLTVSESNQDVEIFMRAEFILTIDHATNKVTRIKFMPTLTSFRVVPDASS